MGRPPKITRAQVEQFVVLIESGCNKYKAAAEVGRDTGSLNSALKRLGIECPKRILAEDRIKQYEPQIFAGKISQHQTANLLDIPNVALAISTKSSTTLPSILAETLAWRPRNKRDNQAEL